MDMRKLFTTNSPIFATPQNVERRWRCFCQHVLAGVPFLRTTGFDFPGPNARPRLWGWGPPRDPELAERLLFFFNGLRPEEALLRDPELLRERDDVDDAFEDLDLF